MSFYREERAEGCLFDVDGDMLLFQWGTYDWGNGECFQLDIIRQLIISESAEDEDIWQLSLTFEFNPNDALRAIGSGDRWCRNPDELKAFAEYVEQSAAFSIVADRAPDGIELSYGCPG